MRGPTATDGLLTLADLVLDLSQGRAERAGLPLDLTPKEFALLMLLLQRRGEVISRAVLAEEIWGMPFDATADMVDVALRRLQRKLDARHPSKLLHAVTGLGYVLAQR